MSYSRDECHVCGSISTALIETFGGTWPTCAGCEPVVLDQMLDRGIEIQGVRDLASPAARGLTPRRKGLF